jgi:hypothetical protein
MKRFSPSVVFAGILALPALMVATTNVNAQPEQVSITFRQSVNHATREYGSDEERFADNAYDYYLRLGCADVSKVFLGNGGFQVTYTDFLPERTLTFQSREDRSKWLHDRAKPQGVAVFDPKRNNYVRWDANQGKWVDFTPKP